MPSIAKILLPVDFSERAVGAARYARCLAHRCGSEIVVLHVLPPLHSDFGTEITGAMLVDVYRSRGEQAARELDRFLVADLAGLPVRRVVLHGDPSTQIVSYAQSEGADLIVMPTHGYGPFRRFILGSNTAKVLHDADCPVWTGVHLDQAPAAEDATITSILCAVDLGPQSSKTLGWASWLQQQFQAKLTILHAVAAHADSAGIQEIAEEELLHLQRETGAVADLLLEAGEPSRVICAAASRINASLVVIGRGSAAGDFGRLRTNAYAIIRQSPCPVASV